MMNKCKILNCEDYRKDGVHLSSVPECMRYKEYALEARKYCKRRVSFIVEERR